MPQPQYAQPQFVQQQPQFVQQPPQYVQQQPQYLQQPVQSAQYVQQPAPAPAPTPIHRPGVAQPEVVAHPQYQTVAMPASAPAPVSKPWHAVCLLVKAPSGNLVVSGIDPKSTMWSDPSIKVGDVLVMIDGIEPASLGEALQMLTGPKGSL